MKTGRHNHLKQLIWTLPLVLLSACGQQTFDVQKQNQASSAPGGMNVPAMVDILIAVDDSGSTSTIQAQLNTALRSFMTTLQSQQWDWRIAAISLTSTTSSIGTVLSVSNPSTWNTNIMPSWQSTTGVELGLFNIGRVLNQSNTQTNFLRPGALLVNVVISNGEDSSETVIVNGLPRPASTVGDALLDTIRNAKGAGNQNFVKLFAAVNTGGATNNCLGSSSFPGSRYIQAASAIGGASTSYNVCSGDFNGMFSVLSQYLQAQRLEYVADYVVIPQAPKFDNTLKLWKRNANGHEEVIPQSVAGSDGWEYVGYLSNQPTINYPYAMNFQSGYFFRLRGIYQLVGNETARVEYTPANVNPSN